MPGGRPSVYDPDCCSRVRLLAEGGAVDRDIADDLGISLRTLYAWKSEFPQFSQALKVGKAVADDIVENALFRRATGYSYDAIKIMTVSQGNNMGSEVQEVPYVEHVPPDTTAAIFWLKNRRKDEWRDKVEQQISGDVTVREELDLSGLNRRERGELAVLMAKARAAAAKGKGEP